MLKKPARHPQDASANENPVFLLLLICLLMAACIQPDRPALEPIKHPPQADGHPIDILERTEIKKAFNIIGKIQVQALTGESQPETIERMKVKARQLGGDALIDLKRDRVEGSAGGLGGSGGISFRSRRDYWQAKVIVWE